MANAVIFVEMRAFAARRSSRLSDDEYRALQSFLLENSAAGNVIPGCGGLREIRVADLRRGKGKRSGIRVTYLDLPRADRIDLITIYSKDEQEDLTADDKKAYRMLAHHIRAGIEAQRRLRRDKQ